MFPHAQPEILEMLSQMLSINPFFRPTAKECLSNPIFDAVRDTTKEVSISQKIKLEIDSDEAFDYDSGGSGMFTVNDYTQIILNEVEEMAKRVQMYQN